MTTFADSSGPTGAPGHGMVGVSSSSAFSFSLVSASCSREVPEVLVELGRLGLQLGAAGLVGLGVLLGRALADRLGLIQFVLQLAADPVQVEQLVHVQVDALDPDGRLHLVRVLPDKSLVQHGYASASFGSVLLAWPRNETLPAVPVASARIVTAAGRIP